MQNSLDSKIKKIVCLLSIVMRECAIIIIRNICNSKGTYENRQ
jgi:hypothetical protein